MQVTISTNFGINRKDKSHLTGNLEVYYTRLCALLSGTQVLFVLSVWGFRSWMSHTAYKMATDPPGIEVSARMNLKDLVLSDRSQAEKEKYCMISLLCGI